MNALTIADIAIRTDAEGRYCLNDLHRASGGEQRHQPRYWLSAQKTHDLIDLIAENPDSGNPLSVQKGGSDQGTFVVRELVYAYAMWISAAFHLRVIRAYDAMMTQPAKAFDPDSLTREDILRMALDSEQGRKAAEVRVQQQSAIIAEQAPKAAAFALLTGYEGSYLVREAGQLLKIGQHALVAWLIDHGWCYRGGKRGRLTAYAEKITAGLLLAVENVVPIGTETKTVYSFRITQKGMTRIAQALAEAQIGQEMRELEA